MKRDQTALKEINAMVGEAENRGDRDWLSGILAPRLAFQRTDNQKTINDQDAFLKKSGLGASML